MQMLDLMKERHSVRQYSDKKIDGDVKTKLDTYVASINEESGLSMQIFYNEPNYIVSKESFDMERNYFTEEERRELEKNPFVEKASTKAVTSQEAFKDYSAKKKLSEKDLRKFLETQTLM